MTYISPRPETSVKNAGVQGGTNVSLPARSFLLDLFLFFAAAMFGIGLGAVIQQVMPMIFGRGTV